MGPIYKPLLFGGGTEFYPPWSGLALIKLRESEMEVGKGKPTLFTHISANLSLAALAY